MENFKLNDRVIVIGKNTRGKIAFIGETHFAKGEMYGVILDEAKGKYSGTIGDICYFDCPRNHGTFVRACQLKKDTDNFSEKKILPIYPNYLKRSRSKLGLKAISNRGSMSEIVSSSIAKNNSTKSPALDYSENLKLSEDGSDYLQKSYHQGDSTTFKKIGEMKKDTTNNIEENTQNLAEALAELSALKQKLSERNRNVDEVHANLRKLKTYLKWSKEIKTISKNGDSNIENFLKRLVDCMLKKIEEIVDQISNKNTMNTTEVRSAVSEENNFLRLYIDVLEKRNEVLTTSLSNVKNILERAWNRSCSKNVRDGVTTSDKRIEKECKQCFSKSLTFNDVFEHETRLFSKSKPIKNAKGLKHSNKELKEFAGSEKIKTYLDSLLPYEGVINYPHSGAYNGMSKEIDNHNKDLQEISNFENNGAHQPLSQSLTEPNISMKLKNVSGIKSRVTKPKIKSNFTSQSQKESMSAKNENIPVKDMIDPTFELKEFISALRSKLFDTNKSMEKDYPTDSSKTVPQKKTEKKEDTKMKMVKSNAMVGSSSISTYELAMKQSRNSSKLGRSTKRSRSESTGRSTKREAFK